MTRDASDQLIQDILMFIHSDGPRVADLSRMYYDRFFEVGGGQMGELLSISFDRVNYPEAEAFLDSKPIRIQGANQTVADVVRAQLREGLESGEGSDELAARIRGVYNYVSGYGARRIARTEGGSTVNGARNMVMRKEGIEKREWVNAGDERVRDTHAAENGHVIAIGERYPVTNLLYPGDPDGDVREIVFCRCLELPVIDDDEEKSRAMLRDAKWRDWYWSRSVKQYAPTEREFKSRLAGFWNRQRRSVIEMVHALNLT